MPPGGWPVRLLPANWDVNRRIFQAVRDPKTHKSTGEYTILNPLTNRIILHTHVDPLNLLLKAVPFLLSMDSREEDLLKLDGEGTLLRLTAIRAYHLLIIPASPGFRETHAGGANEWPSNRMNDARARGLRPAANLADDPEPEDIDRSDDGEPEPTVIARIANLNLDEEDEDDSIPTPIELNQTREKVKRAYAIRDAARSAAKAKSKQKRTHTTAVSNIPTKAPPSRSVSYTRESSEASSPATSILSQSIIDTRKKPRRRGELNNRYDTSKAHQSQSSRSASVSESVGQANRVSKGKGKVSGGHSQTSNSRPGTSGSSASLPPSAASSSKNVISSPMQMPPPPPPKSRPIIPLRTRGSSGSSEQRRALIERSEGRNKPAAPPTKPGGTSHDIIHVPKSKSAYGSSSSSVGQPSSSRTISSQYHSVIPPRSQDDLEVLRMRTPPRRTQALDYGSPMKEDEQPHREPVGSSSLGGRAITPSPPRIASGSSREPEEDLFLTPASPGSTGDNDFMAPRSSGNIHPFDFQNYRQSNAAAGSSSGGSRHSYHPWKPEPDAVESGDDCYDPGSPEALARKGKKKRKVKGSPP